MSIVRSTGLGRSDPTIEQSVGGRTAGPASMADWFRSSVHQPPRARKGPRAIRL